MSDYLDPSEMLPALGGGGYLDQSEMEAGDSAPGKPRKREVVSPSPGSDSVAGDFGRAAVGFGHGAWDTIKGLGGTLIPHPQSGTEAEITQAMPGVGPVMNIVRGLRDSTKAGWNRYGEEARDAQGPADYLGARLQQGLSAIPGEYPIEQLGERATGHDPSADPLGRTGGIYGKPEAAGELGFNLVTQAMGAPEGDAFGIPGKLTKGVGGYLQGQKWGGALSRLRSLFDATPKATEAFETAGPAMLNDGKMALTRPGLRELAAGDANEAGANLASARNAAASRGVRVDLRPAAEGMASEADRSPSLGVDFSEGRTKTAQTMAQKLDALTKGGADKIGPASTTDVAPALAGYDDLSNSIKDAAYVPGSATAENPAVAPLVSARGKMSDAFKAADPDLGAAMGQSHTAISVRDLVDRMKSGSSWLTRGGEAGAAALASGAAHMLHGGGPSTLAAGAAGAALVHFMGSPAWKTVSSVIQNEVGKLVQAGHITKALALAQQATRPDQTQGAQ